MEKLWQEFKAFALKGNVLDLAVAVVIGAAFNKIVTALVANIIMPLAGILLGGLDLSGLSLQIGQASVRYGEFLQAVVDFLIVAAAIFACVKILAAMERKKRSQAEESVPVNPSETYLCEIRDLLRERKDKI